MPSIINASSTGSGGIVQTADASGVLQLQSNGTTALTVSGSTVTLAGATTLSNTLQVATTIGVGGATPANTGAGITFPATQSASTNANTLDDYEEGSWTPAVSFAGSAATLDSVQTTYRKIGGFVFCAWNFRITNKGSGSGAIEIAGFPFSMTGGTSYGFGNAQGDSLALPSGAGSIMPFLSGTATRLLYLTNTAHADMNNTQVNTNCSMYGFVVYTAA